jgi:hypothetical protein
MEVKAKGRDCTYTLYKLYTTCTVHCMLSVNSANCTNLQLAKKKYKLSSLSWYGITTDGADSSALSAVSTV